MDPAIRHFPPGLPTSVGRRAAICDTFVLRPTRLTAARPRGPLRLAEPDRNRRPLPRSLGLLAGCGGGMDGTPTPPPTTPDPAPPPTTPDHHRRRCRLRRQPRRRFPTTLTVTPEKVELMSPGATAQLAAEVRDQNGQVMTGVPVMWASSDDRTARVDTAGLVTAVAAGMARITATAGEASGISEVMVIVMDWATDFVARTHVVDGVAGLGMRVDPDCTAEDCERTRFPGDGSSDFGAFKAVTGVDVAVDSVSGSVGLPGMVWYRDGIDAGGFANARVVRTYADVETARAEGDLAVMFYVQRRPSDSGWDLDGNAANLRHWYDEGLRVLQISYGHNPPARPDAYMPDERLGYGGREGNERGLTELGRAAIREMNAIGMIVDCSHCTRRTTLDAASLSSQPILTNHANAEALTPHRRNKDDEELLAIARTGGVIGVTTIRWMLDTDGDGRAGMDDFIAHIEYIADLVGIDHVGISSDADVNGWPEESGHYADADLAAPDRWVRLTARLRARGWTEEDLAKLLGGNFLRVFREVLPPR